MQFKVRVEQQEKIASVMVRLALKVKKAVFQLIKMENKQQIWEQIKLNLDQKKKINWLS